MKLTKGKIAKLYNKKNQTLRNKKLKNLHRTLSSIKNRQNVNLSNKTLKRTR